MVIIEEAVESLNTLLRKGNVESVVDKLAGIVVATNPIVQSFFNVLSCFNKIMYFSEPIPTVLVHVGYGDNKIVVEKEQLNIVKIACYGDCERQVTLKHDDKPKRPAESCCRTYATIDVAPEFKEFVPLKPHQLTEFYFDKALFNCTRRRDAKNVLLRHIDTTTRRMSCEAVNYFIFADFVVRNADVLERGIRKSLETIKMSIKNIASLAASTQHV